MRHAERAIFDLRRGLPLLLADEAGDTLLQPLEGLGPEGIARFVELAGPGCELLLTRHRVAAMSREMMDESAALAITLPLPPAELLRVASAHGYVLPADAPLRTCDRAGTVAVRMLRRARVLPAGIAARVPADRADAVQHALLEGELLRVRVTEAEALCSGAAPQLVRAGEARVPLGAAGECRFVLFRESGGLQEHVAVLVRDPSQ